MRMRQRGGVWQVDFLGPDGRRRRVSTGKADKVEAEQRAAQIIVEAQKAPRGALEALPEGGERMTLTDLLRYCERVVWKGQRSEVHRGFLLARMKAKIGAWRLSEVTYPRLMVYCEGLRDEGLAPATMNRYMSSLSRALREAERMGWLTRAPRVPRFREANVRERYLSRDEEQRLLSAISRRCSEDRPEWIYLRAVVPFLLDTGLRLGEALGLTMSNYRASTGSALMMAVEEEMPAAAQADKLKAVEKLAAGIPAGDRQSAAVVLWHGTTKSGKGRHIPLTPRAEASLLLMLTSPVHGRIRGNGVYQRFKIACTDASIGGEVTLHTLRHTCASRLVQAGIDLYRVQRLLGHSTITVTERYAHLHDDSLEDAVAALS